LPNRASASAGPRRSSSAFQHANDLAGGRCAECLLGLAAAQHRLGEADVSLATTREAIAAAGNSPLAADAYFFLAALQLQRRPPDLAAAANALTRVLRLGDSLRSEALSGLATIRLAQDDYGAAVTAARQSLAAAPEGPMAKRSRVTLCQARQKGYLPGPPVAQRTFLSRSWQEAFAAAAAQTADTTPPLCPGNLGVWLPNHAPQCSEADGDNPYEATGILSLGRNPNVTRPQKVAAPPPVYTEEARKARLPQRHLCADGEEAVGDRQDLLQRLQPAALSRQHGGGSAAAAARHRQALHRGREGHDQSLAGRRDPPRCLRCRGRRG
jgi:hypothetical protein